MADEGLILSVLKEHGIISNEEEKIDYYTLEKYDPEKHDNQLITDSEKSITHLVGFNEPIEIDESKFIDEKFYIPSKEELDAHIEENRKLKQEELKKEREMELQNQTHGNKCGQCLKFTRQTPNQQSKMGYCLFNGLMVLKYQTICEAFKLSNKPASAWEPES